MFKSIQRRALLSLSLLLLGAVLISAVVCRVHIGVTPYTVELEGLFVLIFSKVEWLFERPLALGAAVLVCTVLAAWLVNRAFSLLQKSITAGRREV